eukprot:TRINITY_DN1397_c1_g1_i1.p1 TRINITY_DN1397_c1_g1~~TRINITY_DN1397_c1_g1_i1.p1  ORF type:complete len:326 (-),score=49.57 TRINITY_DN1397_c1_g1_i1:744-1721(-)
MMNYLSNQLKSFLGSDDNMNILVLGETGSGKSTFINTVTNYFKKGSLKNIRVAIPTKFLPANEGNQESSETNAKNTSESQTNECMRYNYSSDQGKFTLIDTPGLADTRGPAQDDINMKKILEAAEEAQSLSAIIIVANGSNARQTTNIKASFSRLRGSLPDALFDNIILVLTNCWAHSCNFNVSQSRIKHRKVFYINNSAFSSNPKNWVFPNNILEAEWKQCMGVIEDIMTFISELTPSTTEAFSKMKKIRHDIKSVLHDSRLQISQLQQIQDEIAAAEEAMKKYGDDAQQFQNYTKKKEVTKTELVDAPYHSTICSTCNVCHDN